MLKWQQSCVSAKLVHGHEASVDLFPCLPLVARATEQLKVVLLPLLEVKPLAVDEIDFVVTSTVTNHQVKL